MILRALRILGVVAAVGIGAGRGDAARANEAPVLLAGASYGQSYYFQDGAYPAQQPELLPVSCYAASNPGCYAEPQCAAPAYSCGQPVVCEPACCAPATREASCYEASCCEASCCEASCCAAPSCQSSCCMPPCRCYDHWYIAMSGGAAWRQTVFEVGDPTTFIEFDRGGFAANFAVGYRFEMFRLEAEFTYFNNECTWAGSGGLSSATPGNISMKALMFNAYHDFQIGNWLWKPYVGAGLGIYQSDINGLYPYFFDEIGGDFTGTPLNCTSDVPFAYQFRVGLTRPIGERTEFFVGYRYFRGETLTFSSAPFATADAHTFSPDGAKVHSIEIGLRVNF